MEELLETVSPLVKSNFEELITDGKIGLYPLFSNDIRAAKFYSRNNADYGYHYILRIPYAGIHLIWDLIFDPDDMTFSPDLDFNDYKFHARIDIDTIIANVPTWGNWNRNNPKSLTILLKEFLELYKKDQWEKLNENIIFTRLKSEYEGILNERSSDDVEIFFKGFSAHLLVNIKTDVSKFPSYLQFLSRHGSKMVNPGDDRCLLKITQKFADSSVDLSLTLSPRIQLILTNARSFRIPKYFQPRSLADYVNRISRIVQGYIREAEERHKIKKMFITLMCTMYAKNLIEFDTESFSKGVLFVEVEGYQCVVYIKLEGRFPKNKPTVNLLLLDDVPLTTAVDDYVYNPTWSHKEILENLIMGVIGTISKLEDRN